MKEIWKDIKGYEGKYKISNTGNVKNTKKILKQAEIKGGYLLVNLSKKNKRKGFLVHRLVANAFIENKNNLPFINHKDENKKNNNYTNLEWCDRKYNNNYGTRNLRAGLSCRKKVAQYDLYGNYIKTYESVFEAKKQNSKSAGTHISEVCEGKRKTAYGYIWKYEK